MTDDAITVVAIDPARNFGKPMFAASGACVRSVLDRLRAGETLESVVYDFDLTATETHFLTTLRIGEAADEIERLRADNEQLLQILRRSLPKRPGVLGGIGDEPPVDDVTHPVLLGELGEIAEMETTFVDVRGDQHD